jgi:hypothetical protein
MKKNIDDQGVKSELEKNVIPKVNFFHLPIKKRVRYQAKCKF